ncbi:MAG: polysaccharide deacetylase family protein [Gemmatimonadota bacterium]
MRNIFGAQAVVLTTHRFAIDDSHEYRLSQAELARVIRNLQGAGVKFVPAEALLNGEFSESRSTPFAAITVDDGYADFATVALPVFEALRVPSTLFITTAAVLERHWFWWDRVEYVLATTMRPRIDLPELLGGGEYDVAAGPRKRTAQAKGLAAGLVHVPPVLRDETINALARAGGVDIPAMATRDFAAVEADQLRRFESSGVRIGAHTVNHPTLSTIDAESGLREITESVEAVKLLVDNPSSIFCYPNGTSQDYDLSHSGCLQRLGIRFAVTTDAGYVSPSAYTVGSSSTTMVPADYAVPRHHIDSSERTLLDLAGVGLASRSRWQTRARQVTSVAS